MLHKQLSVIIPVLNDTPELLYLLEQFRSVPFESLEIIVVDGGSDLSPCNDLNDVVGGYAMDVRCITARKGRAAQMNAAAGQANGDWLWFLHADTSLDMKAAIKQIKNLPNGITWGRFDVRLSGDDWRLRIVETLMNLRSRWTAIATGDQGIFVAKSLFEQVGGFAEMPLMEDIDLSGKLKKISRPYCSATVITTSSRRWQYNGVFRTILLMWLLRAAFALGVSAERLASFYKPCNSSTRH